MWIWLKQAVAKYDHWCERMGLIPENRRCCAPVRYDSDDDRHPDRRTAHFQQESELVRSQLHDKS